MAFSIEYIYKAIDSFSPVARKIKSAAKGLNATLKNDLGPTIRNVGRGVTNFGKSLTTKLSLPMGIFAGLSLKSAASIETMQVAIESMTGSADDARRIMKELTEFTAKTPFQLEGVGKATKQLLAFGVTQEELFPTMRMLGDIAAGTNAPLSDIAQIFGKAKAKGKLMTEEILQLSDRGIPIIDILAKRFNVTKDVIFEAASKSQISFKMMTEAMQSMTSKGGVFFDQMGKQSQTLGGIFSTFRDNVNLFMAEIGATLVETLDLKTLLKGSISFLQRMTSGIKEFVSENPRLTKAALIFAGVLAVIGPLTIAIGGMVTAIGGIGIALGFAFAPAILVAGKIALVVAAITAVVAAVAVFQDKIKELFVFILNNSPFEALSKGVGFITEKIGKFFRTPKPEASAFIAEKERVLSEVGGVVGTKSSLDVNIKLQDREGAVQGVAAKSNGISNLKVGNNLR